MSVSHELTDHPLLTVESLAQLAERLPEDRVEHNVGNVPKAVDPDAVERKDIPVGDIPRAIEPSGCVMVLKNTELDPPYAALLDELLDQVEPMLDERDGGMSGRNA